MLSAIDFASLENITAPNFASGGIGKIISQALIYVFPIAGFILLGYLVYSGYQWMTSTADPKKIQMAKDNMTWAIAGFIIIFIAYWVVLFTGRVLDIEAINEIFRR